MTINITPVVQAPAQIKASVSQDSYTVQGFTIEPHMMSAIKRYVEHGEIPGHFLQAVIRNDLNWACAHADKTNLKNLPAYSKFFYNNTPSDCWGSREKMITWASHFQGTGKFAVNPELKPVLGWE